MFGRKNRVTGTVGNSSILRKTGNWNRTCEMLLMEDQERLDWAGPNWRLEETGDWRLEKLERFLVFSFRFFFGGSVEALIDLPHLDLHKSQGSAQKPRLDHLDH